jgi:hypothetical protein
VDTGRAERATGQSQIPLVLERIGDSDATDELSNIELALVSKGNIDHSMSELALASKGNVDRSVNEQNSRIALCSDCFKAM